ncbi:DUF222 domain-containing protein [Nocardioides sp. GXQ0305]|uniref:HNH endonuclease signature motif containing protein n=1 Tax=Nocardioides sp. GXQ0305 TaxID=3423912 RepID=UPI003D7D5206
MSTVLDLHPTPGHPAAAVAAVHEALDGVDVDGVAPGDYAGVVAEAARARSRLHALELRLVAAAERSQVAREAGCASTGAWLSKQTRSGTATAARAVKLATDLDDHLPATSAALAEGSVSTEHASVIAHATSRLPRNLSTDQVATVEASLVEKARRVDPAQLRRLARRALAAVEDDTSVVDAHEERQVRDEEGAARDRTRLTLHDNGDGTLSGHFTVPLLAGSILRKILEAMTAPRRSRVGHTTDWAHQRGAAFAQLLEHLPTDHLHSKVAATVVVTLDLETLRGRLKAAGLDTGDLVSAAQARRLACQAGIVPAVLDGASLPLDLGRSSRLFTEAQRVAGATRHTSCAADRCEVPYAWCELHHRTPWSRDGRTDLADMVPLCGFHHRRIHDPGHDHRRLPDGSVRFTRRT